MRLIAYSCLILTLTVGCNTQRPTPGALSKTATLDIHLVSASKTATSKEMIDPATKAPIYLVTPPFITAADVATVHRSQDSSQAPALSVVLNPAGATKMANVTSQHSGSQIAFVVNGTLMSTPTIRVPISQQFMISGVADFGDIVDQLTKK